MTDIDSHPKPSLSVVIPVFNAAATLRQQLKAVLASVDASMEVVVVDNRSTDDSLAIAQRFTHIHPQVRVVQALERQGEPYARNAGVQAARSDLIAFCDSDDEVSPAWAGAARAALQTCHFATGPVDVDALNPVWLATSRGRLAFTGMQKTGNGTPFAHGCNMAMSRSTFELVGGFDESVRIGTDINFAIRAQLAGVTLCWADEMVVHYRMRTGSRDRWRQAVAYGRAAVQLRELEGPPRAGGTRWRSQIRRFIWLARTTPLLYRRAHRARWWWTLALVVGELRGAEGQSSRTQT